MTMTDIEKVIEEARAAVLPFESWEKLTGESGAAYAAFCSFRDYGPERNIRKAVDESEKDASKRDRRYRMWRNWAASFKWRERAADYDLYLDRLKQTELRKTIEEQGKVHRMVTGKMLQVVSKKLDLMEPGELTQGNISAWAETAIRTEREIAGLTTGKENRPEMKQGEIQFTPDFEGL
jgi:hypothetical protein